MYHLSNRSMKEIIGVHPILAFAATEAIRITKQDFMILDGVRTIEEQEKLVARGASKTMNSYHLWGLALDLVAYVDGKPNWEHKYSKEIAIAMKHVIHVHNLPIDWGGDWRSFIDMPHWQLTGMKNQYDIRKFT